MNKKNIICCIILFCLLSAGFVKADDESVRDLKFFLHRLRTVDHMPILENTHTAMSSTYDREGANGDGYDFKNIIGSRNILLDINGPGCIHRIFTGIVEDRIKGEKVQSVSGTKIQIFLDNNPKPIFDMPVSEFFNEQNSPIPYPLVFRKTYPGTLFPIPFAKHCLVHLVNDESTNWGNYWQVTYTLYSPEIKVKTLTWPLNSNEKEELKEVCKYWLKAESNTPPDVPEKWSVKKKTKIQVGKTTEIKLKGCGIIQEMRVSIKPNIPKVLRGLRMCISWDGHESASIDVPIGYFFGNADYADKNPYNSMLLGVADKEGYSKFPMPFTKGAIIQFANNSDDEIEELNVKLDIKKCHKLAENVGRFHTTWMENKAWGDDLLAFPAYGKQRIPANIVLERNSGPGKYVGVLLHVTWPSDRWWGEGDWLIWTDEYGWPPSYHGTGSEEYFNSGWGEFDRKAISGFIEKETLNKAVYSFHLNDAFQFRNNIRVAVEKWTLNRTPKKEPLDNKTPCIWGTTAYWYALPAQPADSRQDLVQPRLDGDS